MLKLWLKLGIFIAFCVQEVAITNAEEADSALNGVGSDVHRGPLVTLTSICCG